LNNAGDRRLQDIHHQTAAGTTLSRFSYAYDPLGNITTWTQQYGTDIKAYDFTYERRRAADQRGLPHDRGLADDREAVRLRLRPGG